DAFQLALRLDVEAEDAGINGESDLRGGLGDAGKDDLARAGARGERAPQFALRHDIKAGPGRDQRANHGLIGVRLHGVADEVVEPGHGLREDAVVPDDRRRRVTVEGRAYGSGDD